MKHINFFLICCATILCMSCQKEIDLEHLHQAPKLVLNSVMVDGQPVTASLSRTWFYTENKPNVTLTDANVNLYVNDRLKEQMTWKEGGSGYNNKGYYIASYKPQQNDRLKITAAVKGYQDISAETQIPAPVSIVKASIVNDTAYYSGDTYTVEKVEQKFLITFRDEPGRKDFYLINFELVYPVWDDEKELFTGEYKRAPTSMDYNEEPLFTSTISAMEKMMGYDWLSGNHGRVFTDDLINGKTYTITLKSHFTIYSIPGFSPWDYKDVIIPPLYCQVVLQTISEGYYRYMKSILEIEDGTMQESLADAGMAEPIRIYSNIAGGTGILGGCSPDSIIIQAPILDTTSW